MSTRRPIRILLATQDGHDPLDVMCKFLREESDFEVIYGGINQTPEGVARQAVEEDVDILGFSIYGGKYMEVCRAIIDNLGHAQKDTALVVGGIIPPEDEDKLKEIGVREIIPPGSSIEKDILPVLRWCRRVREYSDDDDSKADLLVRVRTSQEAYAISRLLTLIERDEYFIPLVDWPDPEDSHIIGLSAAGGAGKSTLVGCLIDQLKDMGSMGILFSDPPAISGSAILLDRANAITPDEADEMVDRPDIFVRSFAARHQNGVLPPNMHRMIKLLRLARKKHIIIESAGSGQADTGFSELVDTFVFVATPDMGGRSQLMKGGLIETADIIVLNKRDKAGSDYMNEILLEFYGKTRSDGWQVPIISTKANVGEGIDELVKAIAEHKAFLYA